MNVFSPIIIWSPPHECFVSSLFVHPCLHALFSVLSFLSSLFPLILFPFPALLPILPYIDRNSPSNPALLSFLPFLPFSKNNLSQSSTYPLLYSPTRNSFASKPSHLSSSVPFLSAYSLPLKHLHISHLLYLPLLPLHSLFPFFILTHHPAY